MSIPKFLGYILKSIAWWHNLHEREQRMLLIGGLALLVYLLFALIYKPLVNKVNDKKTELLEKQQTLIWIEQAYQQLKTQKKRQTLNPTTLLTQIDKQLKTSSLNHFSYQLQQTTTGEIELAYALVPFNEFLSWLWHLNNDYAIGLKQFEAEQTNSPGIVKLKLIISASNPG